MKQFINFYDESLRPVKESISINVWLYFQMTTVFIAVLVTLFKLMTWQETRVDLRTAEINHKSSLEELNKIKRVYPDNNVINELKDTLSEKKNKLDKLNQVIAKINHETKRDSEGFSQHMLGLAKYSSEHLQIQSLDIKNQGRDIQLSGFAILPTHVFQTIRSLNQSDIFKGKTFQAVHLVENKDLTQFSLKTQSTSTEKSEPEIKTSRNTLTIEQTKKLLSTDKFNPQKLLEKAQGKNNESAH